MFPFGFGIRHTGTHPGADHGQFQLTEEPLKKAHIKRHEGKGRRNRPEFSQFLRPNAGFCPVF